MKYTPISVIARALTVFWAFVTGGLILEQAASFSTMSLGGLGAVVAGLLVPMLLLWMMVGSILQRNMIAQRLEALERTQEELGLQIKLILNTVQKPTPDETASSAAGGSIQVVEGEEVGPEFIHRSTVIVDDWVEVEFRNVGGPASQVMAITEGDTETRVTTDRVGSWKSVKVSLQAVNGTDQPFRFCLNFANLRGDEQQQFFRYSGEGVVAIHRPSA
ncbi:MAG: hypothetical protein OET44_00785 [Gammaproteobacteria bacterium]|nr:hypothetical protein [Gammaproteobacteria bacterium]